MSNNQTQRLEVALIDNSLSLRYIDAVTGPKQWEHHPVCRIVSITGNVEIGLGARDPITLQQKVRTRFTDMLRIIVELDGEHQPDVDFDLNQVTNQPGWTLDEAGVNQAIADINAWAAQCGGASDGTDLSDIKACLDILIDQTDDLETIANNQLTELQAINVNTDGIEALLTAGNLDTAAILAELQAQSIQLTTIITNLGTINTSIQTADTNNVNELQAIQVDLGNIITELQAIGADTTAIEATLNAIETLITGGNADLALIETNTLNTVSELQAANATLTSIEGQFTGSNVVTRLNISGVAAQIVPAATYRSIQLIVTSGTVSDGTITYPAGVYDETAFANKTLSTVTFNGTGATAFLKLMA